MGVTGARNGPAAGGGGSSGGVVLSRSLRWSILAAVLLVLMITSYQHGATSSQRELASLRHQLAQHAAAGGRGVDPVRDSPPHHVVDGDSAHHAVHVRTLGGRARGKHSTPAATRAPPPPETLPRHERKRTPPPATVLATDDPNEEPADGAAEVPPTDVPAVVRRHTPPPPHGDDDAGGDAGGDGGGSVPSGSDPIVTVSVDSEHPALLVHTYHDAQSLKRIQSALDRPYPSFKMSKSAKMSAADESVVKNEAWSRAVLESVEKAWEDPTSPTIVPTMVIPLFHDGSELLTLLASIDSPVRLFVFAWNSNSAGVKKAVDVLKLIPYGVVIHHMSENVGFSGAVNTGIRSARSFLPGSPAGWYFIVNADTEFPPNVLGHFASAVNGLDSETYGLVYGPRQDHFAFVITKAAVDTVGYFDEVFYPGYMEDIDYHWRVRLGGLQKKITGAKFRHKKSANDRKPKSITGDYQGMLIRASRGWEYGWMKWGRYGMHQIEQDRPPSGWRTPFNIPDAPLSLWAVDAGVRACVRTSKGTYHVKSSTCWYNGTALLQKLPRGTILSPNLVRPGPTGR